ncbi:flagellar motor switch protein FliG [Acidithiobacillus sp.]|jgi:flagellar motor switch protein FliG|uniref:flagellar motor switch protein FliG n=1 Tax=Acidithiobacillus sp. TaxID=1872118 RepID=UPI0025BA73DC|nr:flagellar motor switch protein FliG [Acidithiobacillus sp.]MCK9187606.1 flagellar motor switch protein FliG [Acidithiobacillus sp.]MCK9358496.1 flagellar motor switch protein FliG [Acidithiobacillus sp.]
MTVNRDLNGIDRSAILLLSLGEDEAAEVMRHLGPREVQKLGAAMARMSHVSTDQAQTVLSDFRSRLERQTSLGVGSDQYIRGMLNKALGADKASTLIDRILHGGDSSGLENLKWMDARSIADLIKLEHPQVLAMILAYMEPEQAGEVLHHLPERLVSEAMMRLASLETVQPAAIRELNDILEEQLSGETQSLQVASLGGPKAAAEVLNRLETSLSGSILEKMRENDSELAEKVQEKMFVFDDLIKLDDRSLQVLLREIPSDGFVTALKGASPGLREKFFTNMSKRAAEMMRDDLEAKGPVRVSEVETAQKAILQIATRLDAAGQINLGNGSSEAMV